jgi:hypothetical protein
MRKNERFDQHACAGVCTGPYEKCRQQRDHEPVLRPSPVLAFGKCPQASATLVNIAMEQTTP